MSDEEATRSQNVIEGMCFLNNVPLSVLYDSNASHSFIANECVEWLSMSVVKLPFHLFVSTPGNDPIVTFRACWNCPIVVEGRSSVVNLFCLPLVGLEIILGMDWLSANQVLIDCHRKTIVFGQATEVQDADLMFLTANQVETSMREGDLGFLMMMCLKEESEQKIEELPVIRDFSEVFPDEIPGVPPLREVEFTIDLVPGTGSTSIAPYRMSPLELSELKK